MNNFLTYKTALAWLAYIAAQVLILNGIDYLHMATPFLFILFLIDVPTDVNRIQYLLLAFATGLVVDVFGSTPGLHCFGCVFVAYTRRWVCKAFGPADTSAITPSFRTFGTARFLQYAFVLVLVHHSLYFLMENGSANNLGMVGLKIAQSALFTMVLVYSIEYFKLKHSKNDK